MPPTTISLRLPTELLAKLREVAAQRKTTVTELLLGPWRGDAAQTKPEKPKPPASQRVVETARLPFVKPLERAKEPASGLQFGPTPAKPGSRLKKGA